MRARPANARKYPWERWFNGKPWTLKRGVDFDVPVTSLRSAARQQAKRSGVTIKTRALDEDTLLLVRV